jgi:cytochrome P450
LIAATASLAITAPPIDEVLLKVEFNPFAHDFHQDPHTTYRWLREDAPAYHDETIDFWALSRFTDVLNALHDYGTYTSTRGITIEETGTIAAEGMEAVIRSMIDLDPPSHTALRRIIAPRFTPRQIAMLEPVVRKTTSLLLDQLQGRDTFDVVSEFSALLPTTVIATLLGFSAEHHDDLRVWTEDILHREPGRPDMTPKGAEGIAKMLELSAITVADRRKNPKDDLLSVLVHADVEGRPTTDAEMQGFCLLLVTGGHETTSKLIANGIRLFWQHPDQRALATASEDSMKSAVEELLRFTSPTQYMARTTTRDVPMHGTTIPAGSRVALLLGCGNRDPREFERPDEFDVTRPNSRVLAFGHGAHVCLGAAVARLEARIALQDFLAHYGAYEIDEAGIELLHSGNVHGPAKMPLAVA